MKRITSLVLVFAVLMGILPASASSLTILNGHPHPCAACAAAADVDSDGKVAVDDVIYLLFHASFPSSYPLTGSGDLNCDGEVDIEDAIRLLFYLFFPERYVLHQVESETKLYVGYHRVDITPEGTMDIYSGTATEAHDPLQMTCTAISDGKNTALLFSLDLRSINESFCRKMTDMIEAKFGVPADHVLFNITHTHSAPSITDGTAAGVEWRQKMLTQLPVVVQGAMDDYALVDGIYTGKGYTDGITFVRRYLMPDGSYKTNPAEGTALAHESEADNEMRTIRIDRRNKKDVLMVNYQTHYGSATSLYKGQYSADFVHEFRQQAESALDCHFVYHSGASGNLNFMSAIPGERKYSDFVKATTYGLIPTMKECIASESEAPVGELKFASVYYDAPVYQDSSEVKTKAKDIDSSGYATDSAEYKALLAANGFASYRQIQGIMNRSKLGETVPLPLYAICFGDIGFVSAPYEMFDTNGMQVRQGSPFGTTFVCSYTNGGWGYIPSASAFPHPSYEVYVSRFCQNTGEELAAEMVRLLKECYRSKKEADNSFGKVELFP